MAKLESEEVYKLKEKMGGNFMIPDVLEYVLFGNNIIEISEGTGFHHEPIYSLTHREYSVKEDKFIPKGFSRMFLDKEETLKVADILKQTNLCTTITTKEEREVCNVFINDVKKNGING